MRKTILIILFFLLLTSCSVHTFTYGKGPKENTPDIYELNDEKDYKLVIKHSLVDTFFSILSFGLYTPTTIIIYR